MDVGALGKGSKRARCQVSELESILDSKVLSMLDTDLAKDSEYQCLKLTLPPETNVYRVEATGALITLDSSIDVLRQYCKNLPTDGYKPQLKFELSFPEELSYIYTVTFPASAAVQKIVGPRSTNEQLAMQLACIEACKKLHQLGALDDHLLPCTTLSKDKVSSAKSKSSSAGAGTTKRKELHGTTCVNALSGTWGEKLDGAVFQAYRIDFSCDVARELYSSFVLLIESALDGDVGNVEINLYLVRKFVKASVSSCGQRYFTHEEMVKAKCFQEFFFNGLFGKLFVGSKSSEMKREFLLHNETKSLWDPSYMFLLLPLEMDHIVPRGESWRINWSAINSCVSAIEVLKKNSPLELRVNDGNHCKTLPGYEVSSEDEYGRKTNLIHFSNGSFDQDSLKEMTVTAIHTGRVYTVVEVEKDSSAKSLFEGGISPEYSSYTDYYYKKYGIVLMHPDQPMLRLKQSHNAHNLLVNFNEEGDMKAGPRGDLFKERKPQIHSHLPPELLVIIEVPRIVIRSIYLMPSVMHRLETLMLASQLRKEIGCHIDNFSIPSSLILEALTTLLCCETFSMERLELLGDSVLKYTVSCNLYFKYPDENERQLTGRRKSIISNANLHRLATIRKLQGYVRNGAFEPRRWTAPGQRSLFPVPCKCGILTKEVPLDPKFFSEDLKVKLGKSCDMGHRWMVSKAISDCAEALIGAYYVSGGLTPALHVMKWLGVDVEFDPKIVDEALNIASLQSYIPKNDELTELQAKIGHEFSVKFLLKEAITHKTSDEPYSYERLEFLGDSVLDILITRHLYKTYTETGPGYMTDLRSANVCNENFAQVAVRKNLAGHLQHCCSVMEAQINEYLRSFPEPDETGRTIPSIQGPKALGDLVESITAALLIDTRMNLSEVWRLIESLLSPLVTPENLELPPFRELSELCDSFGYPICVKYTNHGEKIHSRIQLQLHDVRLIGEGSERSTKLSKGKAASSLLKQLEERNISRNMSLTRDEQIGGSDSSRINRAVSPSDSTGIPVIGPISTMKGGPRTALFSFCKKHLWPTPTFETTEENSRTAMEFGEGAEKRTSFSSFTSVVTIQVPSKEEAVVKWSGEARPDKKSSYDSAVVEALYELERRRFLVILK
ncbi:PREDICTED: endoribonuclease Dicer homolog 3 isoform X2 [Tarenaya hassleriana]|uniref:endoribonuclease Dicer homolog 3 isoform X2 n=1 Tax=Tarenaya hassleriana TaxID=28532 RepID=UPI00053C975B|nr:PREDICTED: endoribonuclease Dicer homolog 3 isoform X2 [Tarenaya hassleriana]